MTENDEPTVEELEYDPAALDAEQSAAWREAAREAVRNATQLGWAFWVYLVVKLLYEIVVRFLL